MKYSVLILCRAQKELANLSPELYERVKEAIWALGENARPFGIKKLKNIRGMANQRRKFLNYI